MRFIFGDGRHTRAEEKEVPLTKQDTHVNTHTHTHKQTAGEMELADEFATEAKFSLAMLREERRQKLRELYQAEARAYYEELAMLGLAPIPLV